MSVMRRRTHGLCEVCGSFTPLVPRRFVPERLVNEARADADAYRQQLREAGGRITELEQAMVRAAEKLESFGNEEPVAVASVLRDTAQGAQ